MDTMFRRAVVLAIALGLTLMLFMGAGYFGAVWTHYFSGEPLQNSANEVSVKVLPYAESRSCGKEHPCPVSQPRPHG